MKQWQRLVAWVLACLCLSFAGTPARAQGSVGPNYLNQTILYGVQMPQVVINGSGSYYGQILNPSGARSSTAWALGFGASTSSNGTEVLSWNTSNQVEINHGTAANAIALSAASLFQVNSLADASGNVYYSQAYRTNGWLELSYKNGAIPTVSSCSTGPSAVSGTDEAADVTVGTAATTCTVLFASAPTNIPHCICNDSSSPQSGCVVQSLSKSGFIMKPMGIQAGAGATDTFFVNDRLDWLCLGHG